MVTVQGLVPTPTGCGVFLGNEDKIITIFVDHNVAAAITMVMRGMRKSRPLTHELMVHIFTGLGVRVQKVVVNDLQEDTFFARLYLVQESEVGQHWLEIDARPSDAIVIALQQKCPVYVAHHVWDAAEDMSWALEQAQNEAAQEEDNNEGDDNPDEPTF